MIDSRIWPAAVVEEACSFLYSRKWNILQHLLTIAAVLRDHDKHYPENIWNIYNLCADSASDAEGILVILPPQAQYHLFRHFGSRTRSLLFSAPGVWFIWFVVRVRLVFGLCPVWWLVVVCDHDIYIDGDTRRNGAQYMALWCSRSTTLFTNDCWGQET